jgi:hypothetical protein
MHGSGHKIPPKTDIRFVIVDVSLALLTILGYLIGKSKR